MSIATYPPLMRFVETASSAERLSCVAREGKWGFAAEGQ
jgi:hypothetical protein